MNNYVSNGFKGVLACSLVALQLATFGTAAYAEEGDAASIPSISSENGDPSLSTAWEDQLVKSSQSVNDSSAVKREGSRHVLTMTDKSSQMVHNGEKVQAAQVITIRNGVAYAPLKSLATRYEYTVTYDAATKQSAASSGSQTIRFKPDSKSIVVNGKPVTAAGTIYTYKGSMMVPLKSWAQLTNSSLKVSGKSYTLEWAKSEVVKFKEPVAEFQTDKEEYRMGEHIRYEDTSYDEESKIVKRTWKGKQPAYFEPGIHEITLEVQNQHGLKHTVTKSVRITDNQLYTQADYAMLYSPQGGKISVAGGDVLNYTPVPYHVVTSPMTFVRSNSPEHLLGDEGIAYRDVLSGKFRINIHNQNRSQQDLTVYLLATNRNQTDANLTLDAFGMGGPTQYVSTSGKVAVSRYLGSHAKGEQVNAMKVPAGKTVVVLPDISKAPIKPGLTMTSYSEISTDAELEFSVVILDPAKEPIKALPQLSLMDRDGKHVRGTFSEGNRTLEVQGLHGEKAERLVIGDNASDIFVDGVDRVTGLDEINIGNTGVLYNMEVEVAPRTVVALNARGGHYAGAFLVNGQVVNMTDDSILLNPDEAGVLYRTGNQSEKVKFSFVLASGSNLPLHMLFLPMPEMKE
ncbi:copper amine oxidase N-terminal domain-containing protein [Paenibacillus sp. ACRRX]|uniref:copper amine oxidase N-terminal domain-containing protein n=1 Tax=Paenibacillus sp. ACRRX TaxID=2918206 RepID=UPI001EF718F5|nr:copper amine oxidase N-terminal domain-containing protein [Paenibacillus sp. ACRRX]MCG7409636.1 copper amine oxidase N-terminal domain-containing protein [Paenibacillus sp. ACRRX]